jgi:sugar lactone lactonase YvrE
MKKRLWGLGVVLVAAAVVIVGSQLISRADDAKKHAPSEPPKAEAETQYLAFQVMTGFDAWAGPRPKPGRVSLDKAQLEEFVHSLTKAIGTTGDARHKLAFAIGPLCVDMPDDETRQFIRDAFAVARENDVAVVLHIDDSMAWGRRKELVSNPANIETADWKQIPSTGRRLDWGPKPTKFPPQMCFNAPAIIAAVKERGKLIGEETKKQVDALKAAGKEQLFGGIIAGWETRIGRDFDTDRPLGFRALSYRGFNEKNPPKDPDRERVLVVKEFMELWANALRAPGIPRERIYCHIAFTAQGLDHKEKFQTVSTFALPEVAFSPAYRPGFSTYPDGAALKQIQAQLAAHGSPAWISGEGTNVSPTGMPSGMTMETYLGRHFNHGAVMVNLFAWRMGGEAMKNNFFRRAIEGPEALAAFGKFLRGEKLVESAVQGFSSEGLEAKMRRIQAELPAWIQKTGRQADATPLMQKVQSLVKEKKWQEVDKAADELLALMKGESPVGALEKVATGFKLAEGPVWDGESLIFSDVFPSKIHKLGADGKVSTVRSDTRKGAGLAFDSKGRLLICEVDGFRVTRVEKDGTETALAKSYGGNKLNGPNDLAVDARDGIYFTDPLFLNKDKREQDKEAVYYISPEGKVLRVADDLEKPNGIALTRDGKKLFVADTAKSKLRAYPVKDDGTLGEGRDFGTVPGPDGVRVDLDGRVYAAGKSGIAVWDAAGKPLGTLKIPAPMTSLAFGDKDQRTMYITTAPSVYKVRLDEALKMLVADEK